MRLTRIALALACCAIALPSSAHAGDGAATNAPPCGLDIPYVAPPLQAANLAYLARMLPAASLEWGDPAGWEHVMAGRFDKVRDERSQELQNRREEERRKEREQEEARRLERRQLEYVEGCKAAFSKGDAQSGLVVSWYYSGLAWKLGHHGRGVDAARAARECLSWLRRAADAGSARAQEDLAFCLLDGPVLHRRAGVWSSFVSTAEKTLLQGDGPYVSRRVLLQGGEPPHEVLLSETNGVKTYYRVYGWNPGEGVRYLERAAKGGAAMARRRIEESDADGIPRSAPEWWLAKDGFRLEGEQEAATEDVLTRGRWNLAVKRRIGRDADGRIVSVSDEFFAETNTASWCRSPWHEPGPGCVVTEELP